MRHFDETFWQDIWWGSLMTHIDETFGETF